MFRLFLIDLVRSGKDAKTASKPALPPKRLRNRRIYERYDVDHKHLALMNDQDILLVRDLSERGFSTEVSPRSFKRFVVGDIYRCKLRYLGEIYASKTRVVWKSKGFVGFELVSPQPPLRSFMKRLLRPLSVGNSLEQVDPKFIESRDNEGMDWYRGESATNIYLWKDDEGHLKAWKMELDRAIVQWSPVTGLSTGRKILSAKADFARPWDDKTMVDDQVDSTLKQFAVDVLMAAQLPRKTDILATIEDESYGV